ncbi:MAG: (Fe-S)-binding protein [Candidatus Bathyarchaeia archaeon]
MIDEYEVWSYREDVQRCMRCGFCKSLCPMSEFVEWESESPRGRVQVIKGLLDSNLKANTHIMNSLYNCALCGYCLWRCPPGVRTTDAFKAARKYLVDSNLYPPEIDCIEGKIRKERNIYGLPNELRTEWIDLMEVSSKVPVWKKADVVYFPGCISSFSSRGISIAHSTSLILNKMGLEWTIMGNEEWCCGNPLILAGKLETLREIIEHNVGAVRRLEAKILVTSCAGCYRTFIQDYPRFIGELGFEVYHISQLMEKMDLRKFGIKINEVVTYHDPCELGRHSSVYEPPRKVLKELLGNNFIELPKSRSLAKCCGGNRVLKVTNKGLAKNLALKRLEEVYSVGAKKLVTACPACLLNLSDAVMEEGSEVEVLDITEVIAKAI